MIAPQPENRQANIYELVYQAQHINADLDTREQHE